MSSRAHKPLRKILNEARRVDERVLWNVCGAQRSPGWAGRPIRGAATHGLNSFSLQHTNHGAAEDNTNLMMMTVGAAPEAKTQIPFFFS